MKLLKAKQDNPKKIILEISNLVYIKSMTPLPELLNGEELQNPIEVQKHEVSDKPRYGVNGVPYIEKHFTTDKDLPGRDNKFAILPEEFLSISKFRDNYIKMSLDRGLDLQECEKDIYNNYRGRWSK